MVMERQALNHKDHGVAHQHSRHLSGVVPQASTYQRTCKGRGDVHMLDKNKGRISRHDILRNADAHTGDDAREYRPDPL